MGAPIGTAAVIAVPWWTALITAALLAMLGLGNVPRTWFRR
jgi:hypothetical protein